MAQHGTPVIGDVATLRFRIDLDHADEMEGGFFHRVQDRASELQSEIQPFIDDILGPEFEIRDLTIRRGSIEVCVVIGTAYYVIASYAEFVSSLDLLFSQVRGLLRRFLERFGPGPRPVAVHGRWTVVPTITALQHAPRRRSVDTNGVIVAYILVTHAVLLGVLLWKFVRG